MTVLGSALLAGTAYAQMRFPSNCLEHPKDCRAFFESSIPITEVPMYQHEASEHFTILRNGYAEHRIQNPNAWPPQSGNYQAERVQIIFTKYPRDKEFWLTDYHWLLAKRLETLFSIDPSLNDTSVQFEIILQTDCMIEPEAQQLFHGIRIDYRPVEKPEETKLAGSGVKSWVDDEDKQRVLHDIQRFMSEVQYSMDSTVYRVLSRHPDWKEHAIVIDWTGSMYGYGAEALLWNLMHHDSASLQFVLFNDGDHRPDARKLLGYTGGVHKVRGTSPEKVLWSFDRVKRKGSGGDGPENDIEAVFTGIRSYPDAREVVLIADNESCIRDYVIINCIDRPVHVILCGTQNGINHQYVNLAWKTGGSIHTRDEDVEQLQMRVSGDSLSIEGTRFTLTPDFILMPEDRRANDFGSCTKYYALGSWSNKLVRTNDPECFFVK